MMAAAATLAGVLLVAFVLQDAFEVMLLPRRVVRRWRLTRVYVQATWATWKALAMVNPKGPRRERFLSVYGPLSMMLLFSLWAGCLIVGFGLIQWVAEQTTGHPPSSDIAEQIYLSGVTFFTLGYGDIVPHTPAAKVLAVTEAGSGFGLIAIVIGYLPVLYQLFSRREAHVIQLDARAGSPPTATTMLCHHAESSGLEKLDELLRAWEIWGSELLESHLSYPTLAFYRSQHDDQSWLGAVAAMMDTCALILIGVQDIKPVQARMTFAMLRQVVVELARSLRLAPARMADAPRLGPEDFGKMIERFEAAGLVWNGGPGASETLAAVRATYEPLLASLGDYLLIPVPAWIGAEETADHWERGPRGVIARRLIVGLADGSLSPADAPPRRGGPSSLASRLRGDHRR